MYSDACNKNDYGKSNLKGRHFHGWVKLIVGIRKKDVICYERNKRENIRLILSISETTN